MNDGKPVYKLLGITKLKEIDFKFNQKYLLQRRGVVIRVVKSKLQRAKLKSTIRAMWVNWEFLYFKKAKTRIVNKKKLKGSAGNHSDCSHC